jgi:capsid protein
VIASGDVSTLAQSESESLEKVRETGDLGSLASGSIVQIPSGVNVTMVEPKAMPGYVDYSKHQLHLIAAGMGVTYEMLTGDVSEVNFSSARIRRLDFQRQIEQKQWLCTIPVLCNLMAQAFVEACVLGGHIPRPEYTVDWATPKWDYVNPVDDVKADLAEISGGLSSVSEKLRRKGYKPDQVFAELQSDFEKLKAAGVLDLLMQLMTGQLMSQPAAQPAGKKTT